MATMGFTKRGVLDYFIINCYTIIGYFAKDMKVS